MKISKFLCSALLILASFSAAALEVNRTELQTGMDGTIQFENYTGPHSRIDTAEAIRSIGKTLGEKTASSPETAASFDFNGKYTVIHAVDPSVKEKLDADIIVISDKATVDHITNLRRIITAYLVSAYSYSESDASTLATFITVYNAVYRGNMDYFTSKYKAKVTGSLTKEKCGLSVKWSDWAGNTQIVIPLYDVNGGLSTIDTSVISDKQVVESMKEDDSKGIDERKNMVDIKEREAEQASDKAQESAKTAAETAQQVQQQKEVQKEAEQKAAEKQQEAEEKAAEAAAEPENEEKQQAAEEAQQEAEEARQQAVEEQQKTEELQQKADEAQQEAAEQQALSDRKETEAASERKEIAQDQKEIIDQAIADAASQNEIIGLKITDSAKQLSAMVKVDSETGEIIRESPVTVIRGRTILPVAQEIINSAASAASDSTGIDFSVSPLMYIAICGENSGNGAVKLCLLDSANMEIQKESTEILADDSVLVQNGTDYYCVIKDGDSYVLAKFDAALKVHLKSTVAVNPATPVTVTSRGIIVTLSTGKLVLLNLKDLSPVTHIDEAPEK